MKGLNVLALVLVIVGALNWGLVALFEWDLVAEIFGETFGTTSIATRIIYGLVGLAGVYLAVTLLPAILRSDTRLAFGERTTASAVCCGAADRRPPDSTAAEIGRRASLS